MEAVATGLPVPFSRNDLRLSYSIAGEPLPPGQRLSADYSAVSEGWFAAMGIPLREGRSFTAGDGPEAPPVVVVSEAFARRHWPGGRAIGQHVVIGYGGPVEREVVGVVGDVRRGGLDESPRPQLYAPFAQTPWPFVGIVVRSRLEPTALEPALRGALARLDPGLVPYEVGTLQGMVSSSLARPRFQAFLIGAFALAALGLAALGLYGVMAWSVGQRRREIGVRAAPGARGSQLVGMILGEGLRLVAAGVALGLVGALLAARALESLLFGVDSRDAATYAAVALLLGVTALIACYAPARRAARTDAASSLRAD